MGKIDALAKKYMENSVVFADAFNFYLYGGEQVIKPEKLRPLDTAAITAPFGEDGQNKPVQKYRDVIKYVTAMADDTTAYLLLGIENQANIHYAMPVRNMLYDSMSYTEQVENIGKRHRGKNEFVRRGSDEFLSGLLKTDRLMPVITLVIYFGEKKWDAPRSLHEMLQIQDKRLLPYIEDYKINLIAPAELTEEDFAKFKSNLHEVLQYISCSTDKTRLMNLVENNTNYSHMDKTTAMLINECTNTEVKIDESREVIDMCQAIKDLRMEGVMEGRKEGREEGLMKGRIEGRKQGIMEGREEERSNMFVALVKNGFDPIDIANSLKMDITDFETELYALEKELANFSAEDYLNPSSEDDRHTNRYDEDEWEM